MPEFDLSLYNATRDRPGGPIVMVDDADTPAMQPASDANGRWTQGGTIGYFLTYGLLLGGLLYCAYFL